MLHVKSSLIDVNLDKSLGALTSNGDYKMSSQEYNRLNQSSSQVLKNVNNDIFLKSRLMMQGKQAISERLPKIANRA